MSYVNSHIHIFRDLDVPDGFLPFGLVKFLRHKFWFNTTCFLLNNIIPFAKSDLFSRYEQFIKIGRDSTQEDIWLNCYYNYPSDTKFVILPMDMAYMGAGDVPRPYVDQIEELNQLYLKYPNNIVPFLAVDPRRPEINDLFNKYVVNGNFKGIKIYPPLGYFPYDVALNNIYDYCSKNGIPVIAHGSPYNPVCFKGSDEELKKLLSVSKDPIDFSKKRKELITEFTKPSNYKYVFEKYPDLKVDIAHFGSDYWWDKYLSTTPDKMNDNANSWLLQIMSMIKSGKYPNFYTDISFTLNYTDYFSMLKVFLSDDTLNKRVLFGSDYYMVETKSNERRFCIDLRSSLGEDLWNLIATENPKNFLGIK